MVSSPAVWQGGVDDEEGRARARRRPGHGGVAGVRGDEAPILARLRNERASVCVRGIIRMIVLLVGLSPTINML